LPLFLSPESGTRAFAHGKGNLLHYSSRALNVLFQDKVITLLNKGGVLSPSAVIVETEVFPKIRYAEFFGNMLITDKFQVLMANPVSLHFDTQAKVDRFELVNLIRPFLVAKERSIVTALLMLYGENYDGKGFERAVLDKEFEVLRNNHSLNDVVEKLLGLGFGLTPSGDDFVAGIIAIMNLTGKSTAQFRKTIEGYDNPFSRTMLIDALEGHYSYTLYSLIRSIANESVSENDIAYLLRVGHTSGYDTLAGIYYGLDRTS
jgi:hypothetical protein